MYVFNDKCIGAARMSIRTESVFGPVSAVQECTPDEWQEGEYDDEFRLNFFFPPVYIVRFKQPLYPHETKAT